MRSPVVLPIGSIKFSQEIFQWLPPLLYPVLVALFDDLTSLAEELHVTGLRIDYNEHFAPVLKVKVLPVFQCYQHWLRVSTTEPLDRHLSLVFSKFIPAEFVSVWTPQRTLTLVHDEQGCRHSSLQPVWNETTLLGE